MAQFTFTNNTYAGEALAGFMASTLLEADSVKRGLLTVINDVKSRKVILDVDDDAWYPQEILQALLPTRALPPYKTKATLTR